MGKIQMKINNRWMGKADLGKSCLIPRYLLFVLMFLCGYGTISSGNAEIPATSTTNYSVTAPEHADDDRVIRAQAEEYAKAFAAGDVAALGDMWSADAVYTDASGHVYRGKDAIKEQLSLFFRRNGKLPLAVSIESIDFPASDAAIEHGITHPVNSRSPDDIERYTAVHVRHDGNWQMVSVTESPYQATNNADFLADLDWLIGKWSVKGKSSTLNLRFDWTANKNIIRCDYDTQSSDGSRTSQTEFIFWNPLRHRVCSWRYDGTGGYGYAVWERAGNKWTVHACSTQPAGSSARANYIIRPVDHDTFSWQSTQRSWSGKSLPDTIAVNVIRDGS